MKERARRYNELWRESTAIYEEWAKRRGFSYSELLVILSLAGGGCTQKEICSQWLLPKQTVNSILKHFSERGWVRTDPSGQDRRKKLIFLTEEGAGRLLKAAEELERHEQSVWARMGRERGDSLLENTELYNRLFREEDADADT